MARGEPGEPPGVICAHCSERETADEYVIYCDECCEELWRLYGTSYEQE
jgi:hypothetical protein